MPDDPGATVSPSILVRCNVSVTLDASRNEIYVICFLFYKEP